MHNYLVDYTEEAELVRLQAVTKLKQVGLSRTKTSSKVNTITIAPLIEARHGR